PESTTNDLRFTCRQTVDDGVDGLQQLPIHDLRLRVVSEYGRIGNAVIERHQALGIVSVPLEFEVTLQGGRLHPECLLYFRMIMVASCTVLIIPHAIPEFLSLLKEVDWEANCIGSVPDSAVNSWTNPPGS